MVRVKICGISSSLDALVAINSGAWAVGEVFAPSPRQITPEKAAQINQVIKEYKILKIGVFVDEKIDDLQYIIKKTAIDMVQLHGHEPPEYLEEISLPVIKAFPVNSRQDLEIVSNYRPWAYLFDTKVAGKAGGTGINFDWHLLKSLKLERLILAGGLNSHMVRDAINIVRPWAVDVSSGVENQKGSKDPAKIRTFIKKVKEVY